MTVAQPFRCQPSPSAMIDALLARSDAARAVDDGPGRALLPLLVRPAVVDYLVSTCTNQQAAARVRRLAVAWAARATQPSVVAELYAIAAHASLACGAKQHAASWLEQAQRADPGNTMADAIRDELAVGISPHRVQTMCAELRRDLDADGIPE